MEQYSVLTPAQVLYLSMYPQRITQIVAVAAITTNHLKRGSVCLIRQHDLQGLIEAAIGFDQNDIGINEKSISLAI
jgi:hypothetical protein